MKTPRILIGIILCIHSGMLKTATEERNTYHIHLNNSNTAHVISNTDASHTSKHISSPTNTTTTRIKESDNFDKKTPTGSINSVYYWIMNNKIKSILIVSTCAYSFLLYQIYQANQIIEASDSWCNWRHSQSLESLFASSQQQLEADLLYAMQSRYVHTTNPTDFIYPLVQSCNALYKEIALIEAQIARYELIESCYCMQLFFINKDQLKVLYDKQKKLAFIKHLFHSWCAQYKLDKIADKI